MSSEIKPTNEACAAVELWAAYKGPGHISTFRAAYVAAELVSIGAQFQRISTKLIGGQEGWGSYASGAEQRMARAHKRREKLLAQAQELIKPWGKAHAFVDTSDDGLRLDLHTKIRGNREMTTLTR